MVDRGTGRLNAELIVETFRTAAALVRRQSVATVGPPGQDDAVNPSIRPLDARDHEPVVALSLRAWAPVFASLERVLGPSGVWAELHPDWRVTQRRAVEAALVADDVHVYVAEVDAAVAGFVAVILHDVESIGEVHMIAVDPPFQRMGIATALLASAMAWIEQQGRAVALVSTGGDPGHAPARHTYERFGFTALPIVHYFKKL